MTDIWGVKQVWGYVLLTRWFYVRGGMVSHLVQVSRERLHEEIKEYKEVGWTAHAMWSGTMNCIFVHRMTVNGSVFLQTKRDCVSHKNRNGKAEYGLASLCTSTFILPQTKETT